MDATDVVIVGGGAAGCVLASRLSENSNLKVVLVEAGIDVQRDSQPDDVADTFPRSYANSNYFWPMRAHPTDGVPAIPFPQAKIMGGGSSVMGMWALRGLAADYDAWAASGAIGWGYEDVLPFFKKLETDHDFPDGEHGDAGPIPIMRRQRATWPGFPAGIAQAAENIGLPFRDDLNGSDEDGIFEMPLSHDGTSRASSATAYLGPSVRRRSNLRVVANTEVTSLRFDGNRAVGVDTRGPGDKQSYLAAKHVIVAAGAIHTPALLLRSGVGPNQELREVGIQPVIDSPYVGRNLQNHVCINLGVVMHKHARHEPEMRSYALGCLRASTGMAGAPESDLFMGIISRSGPRTRDVNLGMLMVALYSPFSRGSVRLSSPTAPPKIDLAMLQDERDRFRMIRGAEVARNLVSDPSVSSISHESFLLPAKLPIKALNQPGLKSELTSLALSVLLDSNTIVRRRTLEVMIGRGRFLDRLDDDNFANKVLNSVTSMAHPGGTCALGKVVDKTTSLLGAENLYVADSSIFPRVPRANTNIPTVMVAEKAAVEIARKIVSP